MPPTSSPFRADDSAPVICNDTDDGRSLKVSAVDESVTARDPAETSWENEGGSLPRDSALQAYIGPVTGR